MNRNYLLESHFNRLINNLYSEYGFKQTNKIKLELDDNTNYFECGNWILSHELKPHDSFKYFFRFELFTGDMKVYDEFREYIWYYREYKEGEDNEKIIKQILIIKEKILTLLKSKFPEIYRDIQLEKLLNEKS